MITSAFTCTGPYTVLIMLGIKRVESRSAMLVPAADAQARCAVEKAAWETRGIRLTDQETPNE